MTVLSRWWAHAPFLYIPRIEKLFEQMKDKSGQLFLSKVFRRVVLFFVTRRMENTDVKIEASWKEALKDEFGQEYFKKLRELPDIANSLLAKALHLQKNLKRAMPAKNSPIFSARSSCVGLSTCHIKRVNAMPPSGPTHDWTNEKDDTAISYEPRTEGGRPPRPQRIASGDWPS